MHHGHRSGHSSLPNSRRVAGIGRSGLSIRSGWCRILIGGRPTQTVYAEPSSRMPQAARPASAVRIPRDRTAAQSWASNPGVRARMQRQQTRDTQPELAVRRFLHAAGLRYRVDAPPLPALRRRADVVFGPTKVALFVDGCFWHGCPEHGTRTTHSNSAYWTEKIRRNHERDVHTDILLEASGWISVRAWEHEDPREVAERVILVVRSRRKSALPENASVFSTIDTVC